MFLGTGGFVGRIESETRILVVPARIAAESDYPAVLDPVIVVDPATLTGRSDTVRCLAGSRTD